MKKLVLLFTLSLVVAGCASRNYTTTAAGINVPTPELAAKYYQWLGKHRKATIFQLHDSGAAFISNAFRIDERTDEFRDMSWRWYHFQMGGGVGFYGDPISCCSHLALYFPKREEKWGLPFLWVEYSSDDWLFFDTIRVKVDGKKAITLASGRLNTSREVVRGLGVQEVYNNPKGALKFLKYMSDVPDKTPYTIRLINKDDQNKYIEYTYFNNKPAIDEIIGLLPSGRLERAKY